MVFDIILTAVNNVSTYLVWSTGNITCYSYTFVLVRTRGPGPDQKSRVNDMTRTKKYHRKRPYFDTSTAVPYTRSVRYMPAAFHAHTLTGMRVPVLQNEDSSCSIRGCNKSNATSTSSISDVCTAAAVDTACARGSVLLITYSYTSMSTYKGTVCLSKRTYRYSHGARVNVLSVERYHTTYCCRPG